MDIMSLMGGAGMGAGAQGQGGGGLGFLEKLLKQLGIGQPEQPQPGASPAGGMAGGPAGMPLGGAVGNEAANAAPDLSTLFGGGAGMTPDANIAQAAAGGAPGAAGPAAPKKGLFGMNMDTWDKIGGIGNMLAAQGGPTGEAFANTALKMRQMKQDRDFDARRLDQGDRQLGQGDRRLDQDWSLGTRRDETDRRGQDFSRQNSILGAGTQMYGYDAADRRSDRDNDAALARTRLTTGTQASEGAADRENRMTIAREGNMSAETVAGIRNTLTRPQYEQELIKGLSKPDHLNRMPKPEEVQEYARKMADSIYGPQGGRKGGLPDPLGLRKR